jgi:hypothetical protein
VRLDAHWGLRKGPLGGLRGGLAGFGGIVRSIEAKPSSECELNCGAAACGSSRRKNDVVLSGILLGRRGAWGCSPTASQGRV